VLRSECRCLRRVLTMDLSSALRLNRFSAPTLIATWSAI
jgi:hypothetical protein